MKDYKKILEGVVNIINTTKKSDTGFANICTYIGENCPELKENEDERIRKELLEHCKNQAKPYIQTGNKCPQIQSWITWLEKQKSTVDINDVCKWLQKYAKCYVNGKYNYYHHYVEYDGTIDVDSMIKRLKYNFG